MTREIKEIEDLLNFCIEMDSPSIVVPVSTIEQHFPSPRLALDPTKPCYNMDKLKEWAETKGWKVKFATTPSKNGKRILPAIRFIPSVEIDPVPDTTTTPTTDSSNQKHSWYQKPIGIIGIGVVIIIIGAFAVYLIKSHFGIQI